MALTDNEPVNSDVGTLLTLVAWQLSACDVVHWKNNAETHHVSPSGRECHIRVSPDIACSLVIAVSSSLPASQSASVIAEIK